MADTYAFHRSYYDATRRLSIEHRAMIFDAMNLYAFEGVDTEFEDASLAMAWDLIKPNIDASLKRAKTNRNNARKTVAKATAKATAKTVAEPNDATTDEATAETLASPESIGMEWSGVDEEWNGKERNTPSFPLLCIDALNRTLDTTYSDIPPECMRTLERHEGDWSVEEVEAMIVSKREEWQGKEKTRNWLTPHTLFAPTKFEKYMIQTQQAREEGETYGYTGDVIDL